MKASPGSKFTEDTAVKVNNTLAEFTIDSYDKEKHAVITYPPVNLGDVNADFTVNDEEAELMLSYLPSLRYLSDGQLKAADSDGKQGIDIRDAILILKIANNK